ncbi:MAG: YggT family protein [Microthrixaceae bacterium]|nr:YggT family protein [Microthrixaceae bacterium]
MLNSVLCPLLNIFLLLIFVRIILSWFPATGGFLDQVNRFVMIATEWIMGPLRRIIPPVRLGAAALDLSPIIVIIGISVISGLIGC